MSLKRYFWLHRALPTALLDAFVMWRDPHPWLVIPALIVLNASIPTSYLSAYARRR
jgi:hypothetical protein